MIAIWMLTPPTKHTHTQNTGGGKTRRWGKSAKSGPKKIANRWNAHFGFFFSQLLSAFTVSKTDKGLWATTGSDLLVSKILHALTLYIELARSQPGLDPCVRALFEMAYSFRSAESLAVKEAALLTVKVRMFGGGKQDNNLVSSSLTPS